MSQDGELNMFDEQLLHGPLIQELTQFILFFLEDVFLKFLQNSKLSHNYLIAASLLIRQ